MKFALRHLVLGFLVVFGCSAQAAESFESVSASAKADLLKAVEDLAKTQQEVADAKLPLTKKLREVEDAVLAKRNARDDADRDNANRLLELNKLKTTVNAQKEEAKFLDGMLTEFANIFAEKLHISEDGLYTNVVNQARNASAKADLTRVQKAEAQLALLQSALDRVESLIGGTTFEGSALAGEGKMEKGNFAIVGPVVMFSSDESEAAGLASLVRGAPVATMVELAPGQGTGIKAVVAGQAGDMPFDPTGGNALKIADSKEGFVEHIAKGGAVVVAIIALGLISVIVGLLKFIQISRIRILPPRDLQIILDRLKDGKDEKAMEHAQTISGPLGELMVTAVAHAKEKKEYIEEVLYEKMLTLRPKLESWMSFVALTAATAPLLGLLGTVTGMINTFRLISVFGTGDPKMLSSGISEALVTTEFGLIVAIPALIIHATISRKTKGVLGSMEQSTVAFINGVPDGEEITPEEPEPIAEAA